MLRRINLFAFLSLLATSAFAGTFSGAAGGGSGTGIPTDISTGTTGNLATNRLGGVVDVSTGTNLTVTGLLRLDGDQLGTTAVSLSTGTTGTLSGSSVSGGTFGAVDGSALTSLTAANISAGSLGASVIASSLTTSAYTSDNTIRTNLGLAIGTNVQAYDADLDDLADGSLTGSKVGSGVPAANISAGSLGASVMASSVTAGTVQTALSAGSNITLTNTAAGVSIAATAGGGGGGPFTNATSSTSISMEAFAITDAASVEFTNGNGTDWELHGTTTAVLYNDFTVTGGTVTFVTIPLAANSTYSVTGALLCDPQTGSVAGHKLQLDVPNDVAKIQIHLTGAAASSLGYKTDEDIGADATPNSNAFGTYAAGELTTTLNGIINTGDTPGDALFQVVVISAMSIKAGSQITLVKQP